MEFRQREEKMEGVRTNHRIYVRGDGHDGDEER